MKCCFVLCALFAIGVASAAEQATLPPPMSSAIGRLANPMRQNEWAKPNPLLPEQPRIILVPGNHASLRAASCSIPLAEMKIPDKPKFLMRELPTPKNSPDNMPVLKAPVCPIAEGK